MPRPRFPATILEFQDTFGTDEACLQYLIQSRWPDGFICPKCGFNEYYWKAKRKLFQCKGCGKQTSITAGTVMHRSKMALRLWFWAAYLVTTFTPGLSAKQFQRQMGLKNYETAFNMLHKLRAAMVKEGREKLKGVIEADESYVGGPKGGPGGRGALGKVIIVGAVEVIIRKEKEIANRVRIKIIKDAGGKALLGFIKENVAKRSTIWTDGWMGYAGLKEAGYRHNVIEESTDLLHIHRVFSNLKTWLLGTHHGVSPQHLQAYLNEFTFRFNRRLTPMAAFQTVLGLISQRYGPTYEGLYGIKKEMAGAWVHPNPF